MDKINIRHAEFSDAKAISEVYKEWDNFKGILPDDLIEPESEEDILKDIKKEKIYVIAEDSNQIVGVCYIDISFIKLKSIRLGNMIIKSNYRNKGIGTKIINKVIEFAKTNNVKKIWLWTQEELTDAIHFYKNKGFVLEGKKKISILWKRCSIIWINYK